MKKRIMRMGMLLMAAMLLFSCTDPIEIPKEEIVETPLFENFDDLPEWFAGKTFKVIESKLYTFKYEVVDGVYVETKVENSSGTQVSPDKPGKVTTATSLKNTKLPPDSFGTAIAEKDSYEVRSYVKKIQEDHVNRQGRDITIKKQKNGSIYVAVLLYETFDDENDKQVTIKHAFVEYTFVE